MNLPIPAFCPNCKSIFPFRGINLGGGATLRLEKNIVRCPVCKYEKAEVSDGIFRVTNDAIEVISGSDITVDMLRRFTNLVNDVREGKLSPEAAEQQAQAISPKLARLIPDWQAANWIAILSLLANLIALYLTYSNNKSSDVASQALLQAVTEQTILLKDISQE
jgi:hypothetical protein